MIVRRLALVILVLSLLLTLVIVQKLKIPHVKASPDIHQGDLVLTGNNVTTIEDLRFDINGSIIVKENATLILRNAVLNFAQVESYQLNITLRNPANGNPRLLMENTTITSNDYNLWVELYGNSSASMNKLTTTRTTFWTRDSSVVSISNSTLFSVYPCDYSVVNLSNSVLSLSIITYDDSTLNILNCTLNSLTVRDMSIVDVSNSTVNADILAVAYSVNCSVNGLQPNFVSYWNFKLNCSVVLAPDGEAPNLMLTNTEVGGWGLNFYGFSNATIHKSELYKIRADSSSVVCVYNSSIIRVTSYGSSNTCVYNSRIDMIFSHGNSKLWLVNSTSNGYNIDCRSEVYVCWYLDVHVIDSIGQDIPSANVTVFPSFPILFNATVYKSELTNANGWARLMLMEKIMNATNNYPVGNYTVEAIYLIYTNGTTVDMTRNQVITLTLGGFIISEFSSFLVLPLFMIATLFIVIMYRRKHT